MAIFLNTRKAVSEIEELIRTAGEKLILISPYLKLSKDFKELLSFRNSNDRITTIIFGKQELKPEEMDFLESLRFVILRFNENLHAKCYANDKSIIITSLNLYEFSMANNKEMGVLLDKIEDTEVFKNAVDEIEYIISTSEKFSLGQRKPKSLYKKAKNEESNHLNISIDKIGFCIRTGVKIPFNPDKPFSYEAFQIWSQFRDPDYPERYCHFSGEESKGETSMRYPILYKNWNIAKKYIDELNSTF